MKSLLILLFVISNVFALTPFSLEGLKEVNVKVVEKNNLLTNDFKTKLKEKIKIQLKQVGLKTSTKKYSNFIVKIESINIEESYAVLIKLFIVEDVVLVDDKSNIKMGITFSKSDFIDTSDVLVDVEESVDYLVDEFLEQYKDEN